MPYYAYFLFKFKSSFEIQRNWKQKKRYISNQKLSKPEQNERKKKLGILKIRCAILLHSKNFFPVFKIKGTEAVEDNQTTF